MPTRPRIDIAGYHHIMNRGVDRMDIFSSAHDKDMFLQYDYQKGQKWRLNGRGVLHIFIILVV